MKPENADRIAEASAEDVASATECTGLVPALTDEAGEAEERSLYAVRPTRRPGRMFRRK